MTITKNELLAKRAAAWEEAKKFLEDHRREDGTISAEDQAAFEIMEAKVDDYGKEIDRLENIEKRDAVLNAPINKPILTDPGKGLTKAEKRGTEEYVAAFKNYIKTRRASDALQEDTGSEGGYLVPTEFERRIIEGRDKVDPIFQLATRTYLSASEKKVPYIASEGAAALIAEEGSYGDTDDSFGQVVFHAYKFGRICKASDELIADSLFDIYGHLARSFGRSIGKKEAEYFWTGTGSSQPQGVLAGATAGVTTAATNKITADEIMDLYYALPEEYRTYATFVFKDETVKEIRKLKDGNGQYIWAYGFNGQPDTILGRPVRTSVNIPGIQAGAKVGVFGDFTYYGIADRQGFELRVLDQLYAATGQVGFRGSGRTDGKVLLSGAFRLLTMHA